MQCFLRRCASNDNPQTESEFSTGFQLVPVANWVALPFFLHKWPGQDSNLERPVRSRV